MKTLLLGASALLLATAGANAQTTILIDDFETDQGPVSDTTPGNGPVIDGPQTVDVEGNSIDRTVSVDLISSLPPEDATAQVSEGLFDFIMGTGDDGEGRLLYNIDALTDDFDDLGSISDLALLVEIVGADGTMKSLEAILNGNSLGVFDLPDLITSPTTLTFDLPDDTEIGGELEFVLNGSPGFDIAFQLLGFQATQVPAPAALALFGLGLAGLGLVRSRRA